MKFEWFVALRYLRAIRKQAFISLITLISMAGVALGVMALIVVISVMGGFEAHLRSKILGINSHILVRNYSGPFGDWKEVSDRILSLRLGSTGSVNQFWDSLLGRDGKAAASAATPFVYLQALLSSGRNVGGVLIRGVDPDTVAQVISPGDVISGQGIDGLKYSDGKGPPPIILGKELARNLGVSTGQAIQVILPGGAIAPVGMLPKIRSFRIKGIPPRACMSMTHLLPSFPLNPPRPFWG